MKINPKFLNFILEFCFFFLWLRDDALSEQTKNQIHYVIDVNQIDGKRVFCIFMILITHFNVVVVFNVELRTVVTTALKFCNF